jgi:hypothetical protein
LRQRCGFDALPAGDWKSFWGWGSTTVPATFLDHPDRITVEEIDSQPSRDLRTVMIECYGVGRYWHDTKQNPTGFIHESRHIANAIEHWRESTGVAEEVDRTILCENDPRNYEELLIVRLRSREVAFGEPSVWENYQVFVKLSEGDVATTRYISRREEAERLLDLFLRHQCRIEELPDHRRQH